MDFIRYSNLISLPVTRHDTNTFVVSEYRILLQEILLIYSADDLVLLHPRVVFPCSKILSPSLILYFSRPINS